MKDKIDKIIYGSMLLCIGITIGIYISTEIVVSEISKNIEKASESKSKLLLIDYENIYYVEKYKEYINRTKNITIGDIYDK